jgi:hypothetical protein
MTEKGDHLVGVYGMLDALKAVIASADPATARRWAEMIDAYHEDFPGIRRAIARGLA